MRALLAVALHVLLACSSGNSAELEQTAIQTMKELDAADAAFPKQVTEALTRLGTDLLVAPARVAETVKSKILPLVDGYLATIDRAVVAGDAYLATKDDDASKRHVDTIRKRADGLRKARERFVAFEQKARNGASADELNSMLMTIGVMLTVGL